MGDLGDISEAAFTEGRSWKAVADGILQLF